MPAEAEPGEAVIVTVSAANTGGTAGTVRLIPKIDGEDEATRNVDVAAGESATISFTVSRQEAAIYVVNMNGLEGNFKVVAPAPVSKPELVTPPTIEEKESPPPPVITPQPTAQPAPTPPQPEAETGTNWLLIGIVAAVVLAVVIFFIFKFARRRG